MAKIIIGVVICTLIGIIIMQFIDPNISTSLFGTKDKNDPNVTQINDDDMGSFSITGNVVNPGTYLLSLDGPTMEDLISAAGGTTSNSDQRAYYLEAEIQENNSYYISTKYDLTDVCGSDEIQKVNVNSDDVEKLQEISGIGSVIANAIVSYRETNGFFYTIEALMNVTGIGNSKFTIIKDYVILHE